MEICWRNVNENEIEFHYESIWWNQYQILPTTPAWSDDCLQPLEECFRKEIHETYLDPEHKSLYREENKSVWNHFNGNTKREVDNVDEKLSFQLSDLDDED